MNASFDFVADRIAAGAVGEPGARTFFVQAWSGTEVATILVEKEQVRALAEGIMRVLDRMDEDDEGDLPADWELELEEPVVPVWRGGEMGLAFDEATGLLAITLEELADPEEVLEPASARFQFTRGQARGLAEHAIEVVDAGRPRCQLCGYPMEADGHICPALNGFRGPRE